MFQIFTKFRKKHFFIDINGGVAQQWIILKEILQFFQTFAALKSMGRYTGTGPEIRYAIHDIRDVTYSPFYLLDRQGKHWLPTPIDFGKL